MDRPLPILQDSAEGASGLDRSQAESTAERKLRALLANVRPLIAEGALIAFSGGVDSAFLLWACVEAARGNPGRILALTTVSPSRPTRDRHDAETFARSLGVEHIWVESLEMDLAAYVSNDPNRCYHCKTELFRIAREVASKEGLANLLYGHNASDRLDHRPGHPAALEAGALTPLADVDLTKEEIRCLLRKAGIPLADKPASPCLSSRIMTGLEVTPDRLAHVQALEDLLRDRGLSTFRVRVCDSGDGPPFLRIEVPPQEMGAVLACREGLLEEGRARGFRWVTLDLGGYRQGGGVR